MHKFQICAKCGWGTADDAIKEHLCAIDNTVVPNTACHVKGVRYKAGVPNVSNEYIA